MTRSERKALSPHPGLEAKVLQLASAALGKRIEPADPLLSSQAGFDSFGLLELLLRMEDAFGISIPDQDLDVAIFGSVETICAYISGRLAQDG